MAVTYTTKLGLSQAAKGDLVGSWITVWNSDNAAIEERLATTRAGNPNTFIAGYWVGQQCWDSTNSLMYICTTAGNAATAVWTPLTTLLAAGIANAGFKVSSNDTTPGFLETKLLGGNSFVLSTQNDGANETRTLELAAGIRQAHLSNRELQPFILDAGAPATTISLPAQLQYDLTDGTVMNLSALTKRINSAWAVGSGNGGLDTGVLAANTTYYVYIIHRPDTGVTDAIFSLSSSAPTLPANYTKSRRVGSVTTDVSSAMVSYTNDWLQLGTVSAAKAVLAGVLDATNVLSAVRLRLASVADGNGGSFGFDSSGNFTASGNVTGYTTTPSDRRLKHGIQPIVGALETVKKLEGVTYHQSRRNGQQIGLIAQDVEAVVPQVVETDFEGMKSVAYGNLVSLLIEAVKELEAQVRELKDAATS